LLLKVPCAGSNFGNVSLVLEKSCNSDVTSLWFARNLGLHLFPYSGGFDASTGTLTPGVVEYPSLTGVFIWLTSLPATTDFQFLLVSAVVLILVAVAVTVLLWTLAPKRIWIWAAAPATALYTTYNWDVLPVVFTAAALVVAVPRLNYGVTATRVVAAGALLGVGGAFKLYPVIFVAPLVLWILLDSDFVATVARRWKIAVATTAAAIAPIAIANAPFMAANFDGWLAAFQFQSLRVIDPTTFSVWHWLVSPFVDASTPDGQHSLMLASTISTALALAGILFAAVVHGLRTRSVPWVGISAALLCAYMLLNKVNSPQYILWLLPFLLVTQVRVRWVLTYFVADLAIFFGWFRYNFYAVSGNAGMAELFHNVFVVGLAARIILLVAFTVQLPRTPLAISPAVHADVDDALIHRSPNEAVSRVTNAPMSVR
jgi:uncharacterized membrane protein